MISVNVTIDRKELANALNVNIDNLDEICHGATDEVLIEAEIALEDHFHNEIQNHDYDIVDTLIKSRNRVRRKMKKKRNRK